jgi:hypothetical protein
MTPSIRFSPTICTRGEQDHRPHSRRGVGQVVNGLGGVGGGKSGKGHVQKGVGWVLFMRRLPGRSRSGTSALTRGKKLERLALPSLAQLSRSWIMRRNGENWGSEIPMPSQAHGESEASPAPATLRAASGPDPIRTLSGARAGIRGRSRPNGPCSWENRSGALLHETPPAAGVVTRRRVVSSECRKPGIHPGHRQPHDALREFRRHRVSLQALPQRKRPGCLGLVSCVLPRDCVRRADSPAGNKSDGVTA